MENTIADIRIVDDEPGILELMNIFLGVSDGIEIYLKIPHDT